MKIVVRLGTKLVSMVEVYLFDAWDVSVWEVECYFVHMRSQLEAAYSPILLPSSFGHSKSSLPAQGDPELVAIRIRNRTFE
jgi:hypothetical protein